MIFLELKKSIARFPSKIFFAKKGLAHHFLPIWLMEMLIINGFFFFLHFCFLCIFLHVFLLHFYPKPALISDPASFSSQL